MKLLFRITSNQQLFWVSIQCEFKFNFILTHSYIDHNTSNERNDRQKKQTIRE